MLRVQYFLLCFSGEVIVFELLYQLVVAFVINVGDTSWVAESMVRMKSTVDGWTRCKQRLDRFSSENSFRLFNWSLYATVRATGMEFL